MSAIASAVAPRLKSVLVATDFSETSQKPLQHALAIARSRVDDSVPNRTFLFLTDFPYAISYANQFGAKLVLLHIVPTAPNSKSLLNMAALQGLKEVTRNSTLKVTPEFVVEFCPAGPISEKIMDAAEQLKVDLIIMGLRRSRHVEASSHMPWDTAYEVVCDGCPVVTFRS